MVSDARAMGAREAHARASEASAQAKTWRERRDALVRQLRAEDERRWTYAALAAAVRCSPELIALIITGRK